MGLPFEGQTGRWNSITDVPGVEVGYCTVVEDAGSKGDNSPGVRSGVTAILPCGRLAKPRAVWAGNFNLNGNGEMTGTHWINEAGYFQSPVCITNTHAIGMAHHATVGWMIEQYPDYFKTHHAWAMPVIAETYDGLTNDICGRHIKEEHVLEALNSAKSGPIPEGNVGGGAGMQTYEFKGGTGTSSRSVKVANTSYTVGVLVQSNFGLRHELNILGVPVGKHLTDNKVLSDSDGLSQGSIIVLIATDIPMQPVQLRRVAKRGAIGIGRTGSPGGHFSGDLILAFSTANDTYLPAIGEPQPDSFTIEFVNDAHCDAVYEAAVQAVEEAVINAMIAAESVPTIKPLGYMLTAIDHEALCAAMRKYGRLNR